MSPPPPAFWFLVYLSFQLYPCLSGQFWVELVWAFPCPWLTSGELVMIRNGVATEKGTLMPKAYFPKGGFWVGIFFGFGGGIAHLRYATDERFDQLPPSN